ncbi:hypothetical protein BC629DRAFT_1594769 [Irpex lacteus]|nr:hypothetical protein BC629DRAFT_1594769 [Irpex lacteus]
MPATRTISTFTLTLFHLLTIFTIILQSAYAAPNPLQDTVVYPKANHHRHLHPHPLVQPNPDLDSHLREDYPANTYRILHETEAQSTLGIGCRRLRLLGVHIRRCAEQMTNS